MHSQQAPRVQRQTIGEDGHTAGRPQARVDLSIAKTLQKAKNDKDKNAAYSAGSKVKFAIIQ
jgi:hypothetical protein